MKKISFLIFVCFSQLVNAQWVYRGLISTNVTDLTIHYDTLYASTYDGIYKQPLHPFSTDTNWIPCGMQGRHVVQTFVPDFQTFICLVEIDSTNKTQIYKSLDAGASFNLLTTDTSAANGYPFLDAMTHPEGNYDTLYFLNHHLKTYDGGLTWDTIHSIPFLNDRFIKVNPNNSNQLIIGGETMILSAYLQVSYDHGNTWAMPAMNGYFSGDNSVHDLAFDWQGNWYAAGEGVICVSSDSGNTWTQINNSWNWPPNFSLYNFDIEYGNDGIYVTGANANAMNVPFMWEYYTNNYFDTLSTPAIDGANPNMRSLAYNIGAWGDDVYFGGHGVYLYHIIIGGIKEEQKEIFKIYPNPFTDQLVVDLKSIQIHEKYIMSIFDSYGKLVLKENLESTINRIHIPEISNGIYFLRITDSKGNILHRSANFKM